MSGSPPQLPSPLLLQLSNTASNEARRHWLLEKRLTAPLDAAADPEAAPAAAEAGRDVGEGQAGGFGIYAHPSKRTRLTHSDDGAGASSAAFASLEPSRAPLHQRSFSKPDEAHLRAVASAVPLQKAGRAAPPHPDLLRPAPHAAPPLPLGPGADTLAAGPHSDSLIRELKLQIASLQDVLAVTTEQAKDAAARCVQLERDADESKRSHSEHSKQYKNAIIQLAKTAAELERTERRRKLAFESSLLGSVAVQRVGVSLHEVWEEGPSFAEVAERMRAVAHAREEVESSRKLLKKRIAPPGTTVDAASASSEYVGQEEYMLTEEGFKVRMLCLRKEEESVLRERERLEREKARHLRDLKRIRDEDASRLNKVTVLGGRYVLHCMLGRGGFSEVYKAYDADELRYVACKVHQLVPQWSEDHKRSYVRHAAREYSIMKRVKHESIVRLFDVFEIDDDSFCTVLELCDGNDLDAHIKMNGCLSEREARVITCQIFAGLAYLSSAQRRVIHYDLKPGNILFDAAGRVKITDFGLSKIMEETGASDGLELTSQGAGTYWYLPPECFQTGVTPKISSKVDVWSAGVIFYQMLFARRPFGHELTQETILRDETIIRGARTLDFPAKPVVSAEAKNFIRRCLTYSQAERPDVQQAAADPYLSYAKPAGK